jgi:nucleoside-diphosphate-sugar epimerase
MTAIVTGAAGFIGSHLCELLLDEGHDVVGVDSFTDYYPRASKEEHLRRVRGRRRFRFIEADLLSMPLDILLEGAQFVFHLAGQPGVRASWGDDFAIYVRQNVLATQRLLEAIRRHEIDKLVYASSSSVYGNAESYPTNETVRPQPVSPYGVTKLAAEHLCETYRKAFGLPVASLRLFTVYGPGQRPDMAFSRLVGCALNRQTFELLGDGLQTRDFTYVGDVVRAMVDAAKSSWCGVANIGGGSRVSMRDVLAIVERLCGPLQISQSPSAIGDVRDTGADTTVAHEGFGFVARTSLSDGIGAMLEAGSVGEAVLAI